MTRILAVVLARAFISLAALSAYVLLTTKLVGVDAFGLSLAVFDSLMLASICSYWAHWEWQEMALSASFRRRWEVLYVVSQST